jgi:hypothetical protein
LSVPFAFFVFVTRIIFDSMFELFLGWLDTAATGTASAAASTNA